jgi:hypothetical protein
VSALTVQRDLLRVQIAKLESVIGIAHSWVEAVEADAALTADSGAALLAMATTLNTQLAAETSTTSTAGLNGRIRNTLGIQNKITL